MTEIPKLTDEDGKSLDLVAENVQRMKEIFPEIFAEDKIDFDRLQELLGHYVNEREDHYSFTWHGKRAAGRLAQTPSTGTLRPAKDESVDWDTTQNIFIEGDNLEVLKLLQKTYHRKVKMIYIDPPYNTGNDFVYKDDYTDSVRHYLEMTGQLDGEGKRLSPNTNSSGRYHTDWLNMMYPRLKLARNLLRDDGVIFISIDDNEVHNLRKVCDEVFGEENFLGNLIWKRRASSAMADNNLSIDHEYVSVYKKQVLLGLKGNEKDYDNYDNPDNDPRGPWVLGDLTVGMTASMRPNQAYDLVNPETGFRYPYNPNRVWAYVPSSMDKLISEGRIYFPEDRNKRPMLKRFQNELKSTHNPLSSLLIDKVGLNTEGTKRIQELFGANVFEYTKPVSLVKELIEQTVSGNDIVLDFFAGSATTANAVLDLNIDTRYKIQDTRYKIQDTRYKIQDTRYIVVQLPEKTIEKSEAYKAGYKNIADIAKERLRRAANKIKEENPTFTGDLGFRVFKLDTSNLNRWDAGFDTLDLDLLNALDHVKKDRSPDDLLYELLLKYGLDLAAPVETRLIAGKTVHSVGLGALIVCLDDDVSLATVEGIAALKEELQPDAMRVVFRDSGFRDDVVKTNALQILKRHGIQDVKSL